MSQTLDMFIIVFSLFVLLGCNQEYKQCTVSEKNDIQIIVQKISSDSVYMRYPFRICQTDSLLYLTDLHAPEQFCHIYSYPAFKYKKSVMPRGNGPLEFTDAENIRTDKAGNIYVLDANRNKIAVWNRNATDTLQDIPLSEKLIRVLDFDIIDDSLLVVPDYTGVCRYDIIDRKGNVLKMSQQIPVKERPKTVSNIALAQAWRSFIDYNPDNGVLAMATQLGHVLEIYDLKADTAINIVYGQLGEPQFVDKGGYAVPTGIMGYGDVHVTKDKIYALFWGRSFRDIRNNPDITEGGNMIEVYDLKGYPVCRYMLDKYITGFCVDEKNNSIMALDINSDQPLVEFSLQKKTAE